MTILGLATLPRFPSIISSSPSLFASFVPSLSHSFLLSIPLICNSFAHSSLSHVPLIVFPFEKNICRQAFLCMYVRVHGMSVHTCVHTRICIMYIHACTCICYHSNFHSCYIYACIHINVCTQTYAHSFCVTCVCVCVCVCMDAYVRFRFLWSCSTFFLCWFYRCCWDVADVKLPDASLPPSLHQDPGQLVPGQSKPQRASRGPGQAATAAEARDNTPEQKVIITESGIGG